MRYLFYPIDIGCVASFIACATTQITAYVIAVPYLMQNIYDAILHTILLYDIVCNIFAIAMQFRNDAVSNSDITLLYRML